MPATGENSRIIIEEGIRTSGDTRLFALPQLPTAIESGLKRFVINIGYGFLEMRLSSLNSNGTPKQGHSWGS